MSESEMAIELVGVRNGFGRNEVLRGVDLDVPVGKTYAFLGRNGAGKTTKIRMLMGLLRADGGTVRVNGLDPRREAMAIRQAVGYLAEDQQMWGWMKVSEIRDFWRRSIRRGNWNLAKELLDRFALAGECEDTAFVQGAECAIGPAGRVAHEPKLVILDDPALGLDPIMRKEFLRDVVTAPQGRGMTVFFSSHLLYEVEPVADMVGILDRGRILCEAETEVLRDEVRQVLVEKERWREISPRLHREGLVLDVKHDGPRLAVVVRDVHKARPVLEGVVEEERALNLDEIFEAFVIGRKEEADGPGAVLERVA